MIQAEKIIEIGKYKFDVSNISIKRKRIAVKMWNKLFNIKTNRDGEAETNTDGSIVMVKNAKKRTEKQATRGLLNIGLYLLRQDLKILNRRFKTTAAIIEFFKRYSVTVRYIESLTPEQMNDFVEWVYEYITGQKKKTMDLINPMITTIETLTKGMSEEEVSLLAIYLQKSFSEQIGQFQKLRAGVKTA